MFTEKFSELSRKYEIFLLKAADPKSLKFLFISITIFFLFLTLGWYGHIIWPWIDLQFGLGPHDIDSADKIRWRRIWVSSICVPGIVGVIAIYLLNRRE